MGKLGTKQGYMLLAVGAIALFFSMSGAPDMVSVSYDPTFAKAESPQTEPEPVREEAPAPKTVAHVEPPLQVKAVYMTSWIAGTPSLREGRILKLVDDTEINSVVIDIKDDTGRISYAVSDPYLAETGAVEVRIRDLGELIERLHAKGVYVIGRVASFQDPYMARVRPELAVKSPDGRVWSDRKGLTWIDPASKEHWEYLARIGRDAFELGFDEINYDYIRFPTDGKMSGLVFPESGAREKPEVIRLFFEYLDRELKDPSKYSARQGGKVPYVSGDIFGMVTTAEDDMGIGQVLENAFPYFDFIAPMVYPSHYPPHFNGWKDPNAVPYEIVKFAMDSAVARQKAFKERVASSTPDAPFLSRLEPSQLRPWLQDNDYPVPYTPSMVRAQIKATYDAGLTGWMLWDAGNTYTRAALEAEG